MTDPFSDMLFGNIKSQSDAFAAASKAGLEQGVRIGRREMKPLIRELLHMLDIHCPEWDRDLADVFKRAQEALDDHPRSGREASEL